MRVLRFILPHFTIALAVVLGVVVIVDTYNPMMGFLMGSPFQILVIAEVLSALATSICCLISPRKKDKKPSGKFEKA